MSDLSRDVGPARSHRRTRWILAFALLAAALVGAREAVPHLFPQYGRPLWGERKASGSVPAALSDLPVIYYDGNDPRGPVAILLSGNGGWWELCDQLADHLASQHVTTVGLNSLAYFVERRTPADAARAVERMAATVDPSRPIMLMGYSYGADVLATIYADLDPALRARVKLLSLMGLTRDVSFGIGFWQVAAERRSTAPSIAKIDGPNIQCFLGIEEGKRSACHHLDPKRVEVIELPGGHHFGGDYQALASHILARWTQGLSPVK